MLKKKLYIYGTVSKGAGVYSMTPYFASPTTAGYVNELDVITDTAGKRFEITSLKFTPMTDGGELTVRALDGTTPVEDSDYSSTIETPYQLDLTPALQTVGQIVSQATFSAYNYEYQVTATWSNASEANKAIVGDSLIDSVGKEYVITAIPSTITAAFLVTEKERTALAPKIGICGLFRATDKLHAYQGPAVSDAANQAIQNRDFRILDMVVQQEYANQIVVNIPPIEDTDGERMEFTLPFDNSMVVSSLTVYLNGLEVYDFEELSPTTFRLLTSWTPLPADVLRVSYQRVRTFDPAAF